MLLKKDLTAQLRNLYNTSKEMSDAARQGACSSLTKQWGAESYEGLYAAYYCSRLWPHLSPVVCNDDATLSDGEVDILIDFGGRLELEDAEYAALDEYAVLDIYNLLQGIRQRTHADGVSVRGITLGCALVDGRLHGVDKGIVDRLLESEAFSDDAARAGVTRVRTRVLKRVRGKDTFDVEERWRAK